MNMSPHEQRLKHDFQYYVEQKLHIPGTFGEEKFVISKEHNKAVAVIQDNDFTLLEAFRGWGKTLLADFAYPLWRADMWGEDSLILSANETLAHQKLDAIRTACEFDNPKLSDLCSQSLDGYTWNRGEIWLIDRKNPIHNTSTDPVTGEVKIRTSYKVKAKIYARSIMSTSRGMHVKNIIGDDIIVEDNSNSYESRQQVIHQFNAAIIPIRKKGSRMIVVGTPQHDEDLLALLKGNNEWAKFILPALDRNGVPTCPELYDKEWINQQRRLQGEMVFMQEYQLIPVSNQNAIFSEPILEAAKNYGLHMVDSYSPTIYEKVFVGTDYSVVDDKIKAEKNKTDYFAICAVAVNLKTGKRRLLNLHFERGIKYSNQLSITRQWIEKYHANAVCLELHGFLDIYRQELQRTLQSGENKDFPIEDTGSRQGKFDKYSGNPSMIYTWERKLWEIPYGDELSIQKANVLFSQLKELGKSNSKDDVADCIFRVEKIVDKHVGGVEYDSTFNLYKKKAEVKKKIETDPFFGSPYSGVNEAIRREQEMKTNQGWIRSGVVKKPVVRHGPQPLQNSDRPSDRLVIGCR